MDEYLGHRKKEGLSIFALLDRTFSKNASKLLRYIVHAGSARGGFSSDCTVNRGWLMYPTQRLDVLAFRHSHVDYLSRAENEVTCSFTFTSDRFGS